MNDMNIMKKSILFLLSATLLLGVELPTNSVVQLHASASVSDYMYPWQTSKIKNSTGSGAIIEGDRILTSAHVVSGARFLEVQKENDPKKYMANVKYISNQADLAIVEVEDKSFFKGTKPLKLNTDVKPRNEITVLGYPMGGQTVSTTTGVISRIEYTSYAWSREYLLSIQVDAAINPGNSGGPAIDENGNIIGIAMMKLTQADNISYLVPSAIINTFLKDIEDGQVDGYGRDGIYINAIRNDSIKGYFGLDDGLGILVVKVDYGVKDFQKDDILLEIDGQKIANDGTIESEYGRVFYTLLTHQKQVGDLINYKVLRNKKIYSFNHTINKIEPLIQREFAQEPRYLIFGGLTFAPLTANYLADISDKANAIDMLFYQKGKTKDLIEPVVWMQAVFPHEVNRGYFSGAYVVESVNGVKIKNFKHFVEVMNSLDTEYVAFEFMEKVKVVLNVKKARESFKELQKIYYLNTDRHI